MGQQKNNNYRLINVSNGWYVYDMELRMTIFTAPGAGELARRCAENVLLQLKAERR